MKKKFVKNFILCGLAGWCMECMWTGLGSIFSGKDPQLLCRTSVWMFPIYGMAAFFAPMCRKMNRHCSFFRGTVYMLCIFATEYATGTLLKKWNCCPWDYSKARLNYQGVIRLDFAPAWFLAGLFFEKLLSRS